MKLSLNTHSLEKWNILYIKKELIEDIKQS